MIAEYDGDAKAVYYQFRNHPVARTEQLDAGWSVDFNAEGEVVGIEVLGVGGFDLRPAGELRITRGMFDYLNDVHREDEA